MKKGKGLYTNYWFLYQSFTEVVFLRLIFREKAVLPLHLNKNI